MAKMGIKALISTTPELQLRERMDSYQEAVASYGRELQLGQDVALGYRFFIAESQEKAVQQARLYFEEGMKFNGPLDSPLRPEQIQALADPSRFRGVALPTLEEAVSGNTWLCGPPELIVDHLKQVEEDYPGVERVNFGMVMGMPLDVFKDQLTMLAEQVFPAFPGWSNGA